MTDGEWEGNWFLITGPVWLLDSDENEEQDHKENAMKRLEAQKLRDWIFCIEKYKEGEHAGKLHYHICIQTYRKTLNKTVRKWYPKFNVRGCHPSGGEDAGWNYATKEGKFWHKEKKQGMRSDLNEMKQHLDNGETLDYLWEHYFSRMVMYHRSMKEYTNALTRKRKREEDPEVDPARFTLPKYTDWSKPLVLIGPSGIGKTAWAMNHFENGLLVSDIEDLRDKFNPAEHDGVVFDDMTFSHLPVKIQIHIVDVTYTRTLRMRNTNAERPRGLKMIFTANPTDLVFNDDPAINRRVTYMKIDGGIYS